MKEIEKGQNVKTFYENNIYDCIIESYHEDLKCYYCTIIFDGRPETIKTWITRNFLFIFPEEFENFVNIIDKEIKFLKRLKITELKKLID